MKLENKVKSVRFRLFGILTISIILIILILVIVNNIVLETFYIYSKTKRQPMILPILMDVDMDRYEKE